MTCPSCGDHGVFRIAYHDGSPADFALCLCPRGEQMRLAKNNGKPVTPQWQVWAHEQGIDVDHVAPMEDLITDEELAARGFRELPASSIDALVSAAKASRKR